MIRATEPFLCKAAALSAELCKPYLIDLARCEVSRELFRGEDSQSELEFRYCPRVRRPRNTAPIYHDAANNWFKERFGIPYRSSAIFCTGHQSTAEGYGNLRHIYPIGDYRICWSPNVYDMYYYASRGLTIPSFIELLNQAEYREGGLNEAIGSDCEIMMYCEAFVSSSKSLRETR